MNHKELDKIDRMCLECKRPWCIYDNSSEAMSSALKHQCAFLMAGGAKLKSRNTFMQDSCGIKIIDNNKYRMPDNYGQ